MGRRKLELQLELEKEKLKLLELEQTEVDASPEGTLQRLSEGEPTQIFGGVRDNPLGAAALGTAEVVGRTVDRFAGAPSRSALLETVKGEREKPTQEELDTFQGTKEEFLEFQKGKQREDAVGPLTAFTRQFGKDPSLAPTGEDIAKEVGFEGGTARGVGFGIDVLADVSNVIPVAAAAKLTAKGVKGAAKIAAKTTAFAVKNAIKGSAAATDLATGTKVAGKLATAGGDVASSLKGVGKKVEEGIKDIFNPKIAPDAEEMIDIARRNNIDPDILPEAVEFGKSSTISRLSRAEAEGITGAARLDKHAESTNAVNRALEGQIDNIAGGPVLSDVEAGTVLVKGIQDGSKRILNSVDVSYNTVLEKAPLAKLTTEASSKLDDVITVMEKEANSALKRAGGNPNKASKAKQILDDIRLIKESRGSYASLLKTMREIGDDAFTQIKLGDVPLDTVRKQKLYFAISDSLKDTSDDIVNKFNSTLAEGEKAIKGTRKEIEATNEILTEFFTEKSLLKKAMNEGIAPEKLFKSLVSNGDTIRIQAIKNIVAPEEWNKLRGSFLNSLIKRNSEDLISFKQLNNAMNRKQDIIKVLFSEKEQSAIKDLVRLADRLDLPVITTSGPRRGLEAGIGAVTQSFQNEAFINILKRKAAEAGIAEKVVQKHLDQGTLGISQLIRKFGGLKRPDIGPKAAQVTAVQAETERRRK